MVRFLDLSDGLTWVESLWTDLGTVHDCLAPVKLKGVVKLLDSLSGGLVSAVDDPPVGLEQHRGAEVLVRVPPVRWARSGAASAQDALVQTIQLGSILLGLVHLFAIHLLRVSTLKPGLHALVLSIKVGHVHHQILDHEHMWQRSDGAGGATVVSLNTSQTCQTIASIDVHSTGAADAFPTGAAERQSRVLLVLNLQQHIQNHRTAVIQVNLIALHSWFFTCIRIPAVDFELPKNKIEKNESMTTIIKKRLARKKERKKERERDF